mgnify:FL=1
MRKLLILSLLFLASVLHAQGLFKQDPNVRTGKLPNGLTYYIRHNEEPKKRAYFYIVQKVGSIQEKPDQRGLAHFLEHMAFNGTKNFPGTSLRGNLERIGVKFGADLNAYTSVDQTVYNIDNVSTTIPGALDSCLLILHDWSHDITLSDKDIDEERGVIHEEWRQRNTADQRMNERMMPVIMAGSKYADCMPIGSMDVVMHFAPKTLRDYYAKWYRPDLQSVVIVGDFDADRMEQMVRKTFADINAPGKNAAKRIYYPVPDNKQPIVFIGDDKELGAPLMRFWWKRDAVPASEKNSKKYMVDNLFAQFLYGMFHDRTRDIAMSPGAPFTLAFVKDDDYYLAKTKKALVGSVSCLNKKGGIEEGERSFLREVFRIRQHGFTATEFARYKKDMLTQLDRQLEDKDRQQSMQMVEQYVNNFLDGEPIPSIDDEVAFWKKELPSLTVDDMNRWLNSLFMPGDKNLVITLSGEKNDSVKWPTKEEILKIYREVENEKLAPYADQVSNEPMLPEEPVAGSIVTETKDHKGRTVMTLSNGAKVIVMPTKFKQDEILVQSLSHGGYSLYSPNDYRLGSVLGMVVGVSGLGNWNYADLQKNLTGINAHVQAGVAENYQSVSGSCSPKDLKYLMEEIYAAQRYPNRDDSSFKALMAKLEKSTRERENKPNAVYGDSILSTYYGNNPYAKPLKADDYKRIDLGHLLDLYRKSFEDGGSFTYTVVGNVNIDSLRPLVCKYLASQPATHANAQARPVMNYRPGNRTCIFKKEQETPMATLYIRYVAPCKFDLKNQLVASILGQILTIDYTKTIREEAGIAYSPGAGAEVNYYPAEQAEVVARFPTSPDKLQLARKLVDEGLDEMAQHGPSQLNLDKTKEYLQKVMNSNRSVNRYWQYALSYEWNHGEEYDSRYDEILSSITTKDIQKMAKLLKGCQRLECDMTSE